MILDHWLYLGLALLVLALLFWAFRVGRERW